MADFVEETTEEVSSTGEEQLPSREKDSSELTDEELEAELQSLQSEEAGEEHIEEEPEPTPEPIKPQPQKAEEPRKEADPPEERTVSQAEHDRILRQLEQEKLWAARRSTEIGELRKQLRSANERLAQNLKEIMEDDPVEGTNRLLQIKQNNEHTAQLDREESEIQQVVESRRLFLSYVKPDEADLDGMVSALERDGLPPEYIRQFRQDPFRSAHAETLVQLAKRAQAETLVFQALDALKKQAERIKQLEGEVKTRPAKVLENVGKALKQRPNVTAASGGSSAKESIKNSDPTKMSDAELEEYLRNHS